MARLSLSLRASTFPDEIVCQKIVFLKELPVSALPHVQPLFHMLTPCTTFPIKIKYWTTFPAWAKCFHFVLHPAIYIVIAVGLHFYYQYDVAHLQLLMGLSARALSVPFQIKHGVL